MKKVVAYCIAGGLLLILADETPRLATGTTALILLAVVLTHSNQLTAVSKFISQNIGS